MPRLHVGRLERVTLLEPHGWTMGPTLDESFGISPIADFRRQANALASAWYQHMWHQISDYSREAPARDGPHRGKINARERQNTTVEGPGIQAVGHASWRAPHYHGETFAPSVGAGHPATAR